MNCRIHLMLLATLAYSSAALADDKWQFSLTPYIWFAGLKGDVSTIPGAPVAPIDVSPKEAFDDTETAIMVMLDAKKGINGVYTDFIYTDVQQDATLLPAPVNLTLKSTTKATAFTLAYQREVYRDDSAFVDLLAGARYWKIDSELAFGNGLGLLAGKKVSNDESWVDPVIGVKGRTSVNDTGFYVTGGVSLGGFNVGSDRFYDWLAAVGYQWRDNIGTAIGYRMFDLDYEDDGFVYDVKQKGWIVGLTWTF